MWTHRDQAEDTLGVVLGSTGSSEGDRPVIPKVLEVGIRASVVLGWNDRHALSTSLARCSGFWRWTHRREVSRANAVDPDTQIPPGELCGKLVTERDGGSLARVVVELTTLRGLCDTRDGGEVDDVSGLGGSAHSLGRGEQGEEGERGEVVRGGVDLVGG